MDNTLVMVFSDNGASAEGGVRGTFNEHRFTDRVHESLEDNLSHYDDWGGFTSYSHYSWAWAWAGNTPHKLWKRYTWLGGTRTPLIVHWGGRVAEPGVVRGQFAHAIDLMPTVLAAAGLAVPGFGRRGDPAADGRRQPAYRCSSDPAAAELHHTQYFEMMGSRSIYHQGWKATTDHISWGVVDEEDLATGSRDFAEDRWELFDLSVDFSEAVDRGGDEPARLASLVELWNTEADRNQVLPISDQLADRFAGFVAPAWPAGQAQVYLPGGGAVVDESLPLLWGGFRMTADVEIGPGAADGVVCALGDWFGGWALYLVDGRAHFTFARASGVLELAAPSLVPTGRHTLAVFYAPGVQDGPGRMVLLMDDDEVDEIAVDSHLPLALQHGGAGLRLGTRHRVPGLGALLRPRSLQRHHPPSPGRGTRHLAPRPRHRGQGCPARRLRAVSHPASHATGTRAVSAAGPARALRTDNGVVLGQLTPKWVL